MLDRPDEAFRFYDCLQQNTSTAQHATVDALAAACAKASTVSDPTFAKLASHVHSWVGDEAVGGMATTQATHLRRADADHGPNWPHIVLGSGDGLVATPYDGPPTADGLRRAVCAAGAKYSRAPTTEPAACDGD